MTLIKELNHVESKMKQHELVTDKPGIYRAGHAKASDNNNAKGFSPGQYTSQTEPKEIEVDKFAKQISNILEHAYSINQYEKLILVAEPHFLGSLKKNLSNQTKKSVKHTISKDGIHIAESDLHRMIQRELIVNLVSTTRPQATEILS
jgi:protein required for attachment to host cells